MSSERVLIEAGWHRAALALACGVLLALPSTYAPSFVLGWFAWLPLLFALEGRSLRASYGLGVIAGLGFYAIATHWVVDFLVALKGYGRWQSTLLGLLYWVYSAQVVGLIAVLYIWCRRRAPLLALATLPLIIVVAYDTFPSLFTLRLGESQSYLLPALQAVEFTGVQGLDCVVVLLNVVSFAALVHRDERAGRWLIGVAAAVIMLWFGYGLHATTRWDARLAQWDRVRVGIVQPNEQSSLDIASPRAGYSRAYPPEMALTRELAAAGAELAIWPETRFKGYFDSPHVQRAYQHELAELRLPLVFHDTEHVDVAGAAREYNTAAFIDAAGNLAGTYRKRQRIPFGEYLPLLDAVPALQAQAQQYFGFNEVQAGVAPAVFSTQRLAMVPLICYEAVFPLLVAQSLSEPAGKVLVTLSNDAWFGDTRQPYIHTSISILRTVENRVPLVHVVNNGPSLVVAPNGRILWRSEFRTAGGHVVDLPYAADSGGSFFNRHPRWFMLSSYVLLIAALLASTMRR